MVNNIVVDSSFWVALYYTDDPHHTNAVALHNQLLQTSNDLLTNSVLIWETLTVLLYRTKNLTLVQKAHEDLKKNEPDNLEIMNFSSQNQDDIMNIFLYQQKYKSGFLSFADCTVIFQSRQENASTVLTFDKGFKQFESEFEILGV